MGAAFAGKLAFPAGSLNEGTIISTKWKGLVTYPANR